MFAEVTLSTEVAVGLVISGFAAMGGAVGLMFKMLISNYEKEKERQDKDHEREIEALKTQRDNWRQVGESATYNLKQAAVKVTEKPFVLPLAPVVAEHSSPPTEEQKEAAALATVRATLVAATLALELPARQEEGTDPSAIVTASSTAQKSAVVAILAEEVADEVTAKNKAEAKEKDKEIEPIKEEDHEASDS